MTVGVVARSGDRPQPNAPQLIVPGSANLPIGIQAAHRHIRGFETWRSAEWRGRETGHNRVAWPSRPWILTGETPVLRFHTGETPVLRRRHVISYPPRPLGHFHRGTFRLRWGLPDERMGWCALRRAATHETRETHDMPITWTPLLVRLLLLAMALVLACIGTWAG